jgi:cation diffusion facilitator CzcD-associated flavoprotein CzcO
MSAQFSTRLQITEKGLKTESGDLHEVDIIICVTGFDVRFVPGFSLTGFDGKSIQKDWAQEPNCYLGIAAPHFPNYFIVLGPRGPWGNGPLLASLETMCDHFVEVMRKMQKERIKSLEVKLEPTIKFNQHVSSWLRGAGAPSPWGGSVWNGGCKSWYKMGSRNGEVWLWPGGVSNIKCGVT